MRRQRDQRSRAFDQLSSLVFHILRSSSSDQISNGSSLIHPNLDLPRPASQISPAGLASLLLGISLSLMLCGSVTFFIGFLLMPWVLGLVFCLYVFGIVSNLSILGRAILCQAAELISPRKTISDEGWKLM